eukprot:5147567-Pyramimonas_sp.AAC.1
MATGKWCHVPKKSSDPKGVLLQFGRKKGAAHVWLRKQGHVHVSASAGATDQILAQIEAWTVPWNNGNPPVPWAAGGQSRLPSLPPLPPAEWSPPPASD